MIAKGADAFVWRICTTRKGMLLSIKEPFVPYTINAWLAGRPRMVAE